jgi:hypothetical protein
MMMSQMAEVTATAEQDLEFSFADAVGDAQQMVMDFLGGSGDGDEQDNIQSVEAQESEQTLLRQPDI